MNKKRQQKLLKSWLLFKKKKSNFTGNLLQNYKYLKHEIFMILLKHESSLSVAFQFAWLYIPLINFVWNLLKIMPCFRKFNILLMKPLSNISVLQSSIPIYFMYQVIGDNPLSHLKKCILQRNAKCIICFAKFNDHTILNYSQKWKL